MKPIFIWLFAGLFLFIVLNKHSKSGIQNYHSQIWGDKSGYYVYLPAVFNYGFDARQFPDSIDIKTGNGFSLDRQKGKIHTKYTCGVAIMQAPFYLAVQGYCNLFGKEANGFSKPYHHAIDLAAFFYTFLGLFFLFKLLQSRHKEIAVYLTLLSVLLATNVFYYASDETGMSHIYSFALFSWFLYFLHKNEDLQELNYKKLLFFGVLCGMIVLVRPTNIVFLSAYLFLDLGVNTTIALRLKRLMTGRVLLPLAIGFVFALSPQLLYWWHTFDSPFYYSYHQEGFNWFHPMLAPLWFSPHNGLFLYGPFYVLLIPALIFYWKKQRNNSLYISILFLSISYLFSCWHDWSFGCAFGSRNFVEYTALFCLPLASWFEKLFFSGLRLRLLSAIFVLGLIVFNLKLAYSYDGCFAGTKNWDWPAYGRLVSGPTK